MGRIARLARRALGALRGTLVTKSRRWDRLSDEAQRTALSQQFRSGL